MTWLRTREIKPGVHETQSAGFHALVQIGIVVGILAAGFALVLAVQAVFSGNWSVLLWGIPLGAIGYAHYDHAKRHPAEPRRPGPWD